MTISLPLGFPAFTYEAVTPSLDCKADQALGETAAAQLDLHGYFAERVSELLRMQEAVQAEFETLLQSQSDTAGALLDLGQTAHEQAEEADALLGIMVRCEAPMHLVKEAEGAFDALRRAEEQITEALEWDRGMGRRLSRIQDGAAGRRSVR